MRIIAGKWRSRIIDAPPGRDTRPTTDRVREAWMSALQPEIPGSTVLDLFAGSGALGLETLSRGASAVTFVEKAAPALRALHGNITKLGADHTTVVKADALRFVRELEPGAFDLVLADPPYGHDFASTLIRLFLERPYARMLSVEHGVGEVIPDIPEARIRRYGDTAITTIPAPQ